MGKTIINILTSPISLVNQKVGDAISGAVITAIGFASGNPFLVSFGLSRLAGALQSLPKPPSTETAIKTERPPRVSAYGRSHLYGAYMLFTSNGTAIDVYAVHDGRIDGWESYYLGDKIVGTTTGVLPGLPDGAYSKHTTEIGSRVGLPTETAYSRVVAEVPDQWTANHRGDGIASLFVAFKSAQTKHYQEVYPNGTPAMSAVARWQRVFDWRDVTQDVGDPLTWKWSENAVLHLAHYLLVRDAKDWDTHFAPTLDYWTAAADDADVVMPLKGIQAVLTLAAAPDLDHNLHLSSVNGLAIGMTITISATGDTSLSETRTVASITGLVVGLSSEISHDHPLGSQVTWASDAGSPATEARYRSCVAHAHTDEHKGVIKNLLSCFDGWLAPRFDGALVVYSGRYYEPTVTIGPDAIVSYSIQDGVEEEAALNEITIGYVSPNHDFNTVDGEAWRNEADITARGKVLSDSLTLQVPSHSQLRRLAKRLEARTMAPKRGTLVTNSKGRAAIGQRYINLPLVEAGTEFYNGPVEVAKMTRNVMTGGLSIDWIAADPNIDAWNPATEEGSPAPVGNVIAAGPLVTPTVTTLTPQIADGGAQIDIIVDAPDRDDLTWYVRWKASTNVLWNEAQYTDIDPGTAVELLSALVPLNAMIDVAVAYQVGDGRVSDWSPTETADTTTAGLAPGPTSSVTASGGVGTLTVGWRNPASINYSYTRAYYGTTNVFGAAAALTPDDAASPSALRSVAFTGIAPGTYYVWTRAYSTSGVPAAAVQSSGTTTVT